MAHNSADTLISLQHHASSVRPHFYSLLVSVLRSGHGGEDTPDETQDEQVQAGRRFGLQAGAGLPQGKEGVGGKSFSDMRFACFRAW